MKKILATALTIAMLASGATTLAEFGGPQGGPGGDSSRMEQRDFGGREERDAVSGARSDSGSQERGDDRPSNEDGGPQERGGDRRQIQDGGGQERQSDGGQERQSDGGQERWSGGTREMPVNDDARQTPTGEQSREASGESNDGSRQVPTDQQSAEATSGNDRQAPSGQMPGSGSQNQMPGSGSQNQMPAGDRQKQDSAQGAPAGMREQDRVDFDALVTDGVISSETRDSIKSYMDDNKPSEGQIPERDNKGKPLSLVDELLYSKVISATEYEAINAAQKKGQVASQSPDENKTIEMNNGDQQNGQMPGMPNSDQQGNQQNGQMPGMNNGQQNGQMPGMPGDMSNDNTSYSAAATVTENSDGSNYASTGANENAVLVTGKEISMTNATVTKTGSANGENADFNGVNAAVLANNGATLTISDTSVTTDGAHANGVFSYGAGTTVNVSNTAITTTGNNSGGLMTTGGATMNATDLTVSTSGNSSAAIRSDRGGGTVNVERGSYDTTGVGSPAIYSTADITVSDATLSASNSEAVVIEGGNRVTLKDVDITGSNTRLNGQSTQKTNVLIYQSMSGDASEGSSDFTMSGGTMTALSGSMFHVTNVTTTINLENVDFTYASDSDVFLDASADAWGSSGKNGGNVTLNLVDQDITGAILTDAASSVTVNLDADSTWTLTGDSAVSAFNGDLKNVNTNGYKLYVGGVEIA